MVRPYPIIDRIELFLHEQFHHSGCSVSYAGTRTKDSCYTCLVQEIIVLCRDNTTRSNHDVLTTQFLEFCNNLRNQSLVTSSQRRNTKDMYIILYCLLSSLFWSLEQWSHIDRQTLRLSEGRDSRASPLIHDAKTAFGREYSGAAPLSPKIENVLGTPFMGRICRA